MLPAPLEDVHYIDRVTKYQVRSLRPTFERGRGTTEILDPTGKVLWSLGRFTGRHHLDLSPDGRYLVLSGHHDLGPQLHIARGPTSLDQILATVYCGGTEMRTVRFSELFSTSAEELAMKRGVLVKGGGWANLDDFFRLSVDWTTPTLVFSLYTHETITIGFA